MVGIGRGRKRGSIEEVQVHTNFRNKCLKSSREQARGRERRWEREKTQETLLLSQRSEEQEREGKGEGVKRKNG